MSASPWSELMLGVLRRQDVVMSSSSWSELMWGFRFDRDILREKDGTKKACSRNRNHDIIVGKSFCPECGAHIEDVPNLVPSLLVDTYAAANGMSAHEALEHLAPYNRKVHVHHDTEVWIFGLKLAEAGSYDGVVEIHRRADSYSEINEIFKGLNLDASVARNFLISEVHG